MGEVCLGVIVTGQMTGVEEKLQAAEAALQGAEPDDKTRNLIGHIAASRACWRRSEPGGHHHCPVAPRSGVSAPRQPGCPHCHLWKLGIAYHLQGDRAAAAGPIAKP